MAAFHFCAKIHSRANGASAVRSAAYRAAERLYDARAGKHEDYTRKADVMESAIFAPPGAPPWVQDRNELWNRAETAERRRDSQVAQELEINLPRELSDEENWQLICDFAREHLVAHGRVCDINLHVGRASDGSPHPHAHILMPVRELNGDKFRAKHPDCSWQTFVKRRDRLNELREVWCDFARERARDLDHDLGPEWDHRSLETRGIDLEPQPKRGATAQRLDREADKQTPAERTAEWEAARRRNGVALLRDPGIALHALTGQHSTFDEADLARYIFQHSAQDQFQHAFAAARALAVPVGQGRDGKLRLSTREMIALEARMVENAEAICRRTRHAVRRDRIATARDGLSEAQGRAAVQLLADGDLTCLVGYAGAGKSTLLRNARAAWAAQGYTVKGAALSGIAAEGLRTGSGIEARTIRSLEHAWAKDREPLGPNDVLVIDEAGMIESRVLAGLVERCQAAGAKLVLVGDPEQLQAIGAGAAFRAIIERVGAHTLSEVWRQRADWQRAATRDLAEARTADALASYRAQGCIEAVATDAEARLRLVEAWQAERAAQPDGSRIMLAHTNADVQRLNGIARDLLRADGQLGLNEVTVATNFGERGFASGDRLIFRRNDRSMDVRNGTIGTVTEAEPGRFAVRLDDGRQVELDPTCYRDIDHGFAVTCHRAQGVTVDSAFVLATQGFDRHLTYVACTRHRDRLTLVHSRESFATDGRLAATLSRERAKDTTLDYREQESPEWQSPAYNHPAPRPTQAFIDAHRPEPKTEVEQMFEDWAQRAPDHERTFEWRTKDRGWEL